MDCRVSCLCSTGLDQRGKVVHYANLSCSDLDSGDARHGVWSVSIARLLTPAYWILTKAERQLGSRQASLISTDFRGARPGNADFNEVERTQARFAGPPDLKVWINRAQIGRRGKRPQVADLRGIQGLTCDTLKQMEDWSNPLIGTLSWNAGQPRLGSCGPGAVTPATLHRQVPCVPRLRRAVRTCMQCDRIPERDHISTRPRRQSSRHEI